MTTPAPIVGLILAGGLSRRMGGGDKALLAIGGQPILQRVIERVRPQVSKLLLNANGDAARLGTDLVVVPDNVPGRPGPLAGILAGLDHIAAHMPDGRWLLSVPTDSPFLPADLAARLWAGLDGRPAACAASGERTHPVVGLFSVALRHELRRLLTEENERRVGHWARTIGAATVRWPASPYDPFFNVNTPSELAEAEAVLAAYPGA